MPGRRFTDERIALAPHRTEGGAPVDEIGRRMGIAEATFYRWKKVYDGAGGAPLSAISSSPMASGKLKRLVADRSLDKEMPRGERKRAIGSTAARALRQK